ncbi:CCA tRNA nucleotidyltransferase [Galactobacter caseinivorans]|uniref:CCA tRNA nucleotidyltransferase n=1 Tax=Galactobacter caseinivorans TaxID=2676123 RepID=UPI001F16F79A|nr:CCA tRNA nucleotidyltransferase [Galactobacter caseinivorans]
MNRSALVQPNLPADLPAVAVELGHRFESAGYELSLVGGPVRDLFLGRPALDLDFTTSANPDQILDVIKGWAEVTWEVGRDYGTIALRRGDDQIEITTYRADVYEEGSRKPHVRFGQHLDDDLARRDFTVNSMAVRLPSGELVDPFGGLGDLELGVLRTPSGPEISFSDDPLRMMRGARFVSQLGLELAPAEWDATAAMAGRLEIVSAERVRDELSKLLLGAHPERGIDVMVRTGLAELVIPEVSALRLEADEHHRHKDVYEHSLTVLRQAADREGGPDDAVPGPDLVLRMAALMHDIGKPATRRFEGGGAVTFRHHDVVGAKLVRKRLKSLRFPKDVIQAVSRLVELHMRFYGYADAGWSDSAVRRYVTDAGPLLSRLHLLTRSDVTTRNRRKAERLEFAYDDLEIRAAELAAQEQLDAIRPDLDGQEIMAELGIKPGPLVGRAYKFLLEQRLDRGPVTREQAVAELHEWWAQQPEATQG